jgi:hypothetical protein
VVVNFLKPLQDKHRELSSNLDQVEAILTKSEEKARSLASQTLQEVREKIGVE